MRILLFVCALAVAATLAGRPALAFHCPLDMRAIDARLAQGPALPKKRLIKVRELRARGEALHKAGKHGRSVKVLGEAKALLGIK